MRIDLIILCAGLALAASACDIQKAGLDNDGDQQVGGSSIGGSSAYPIDRHPVASASDGSPSASQMMGDYGVLSYKDGCLFMAREGKTIGLVAPANATFDGRIFGYRNMRFELGQKVKFDGSIVSSGNKTNLNCKGTSEVISMAP